MTPKAAARRFVDVVLRFGFTDVLDLIELPDEQPEAQKTTRAAYAQLEAALRKQAGHTTHDHLALFNAVIAAAPRKYGAAITAALDRFDTALTEELVIKEQAAYLIGCEVGAVLRRPVPLAPEVRPRPTSRRRRR